MEGIPCSANTQRMRLRHPAETASSGSGSFDQTESIRTQFL